MIICDGCFCICEPLNTSRSAGIEEEEQSDPEGEAAGYSDRFDAVIQVSLEEAIAVEISCAQEELPEQDEPGEDYLLRDENLQQLAQSVLRLVVKELRPDLLAV